MIATFASSVAAIYSCLGCDQAAQQAALVDQARAAQGVRVADGMVSVAGAPVTSFSATVEGPSQERVAERVLKGLIPAPQVVGTEARLPIQIGSEFGVAKWAQDEDMARFRALDLSTPLPVRSLGGEEFAAEFAFAAGSERTGLGLDVALAPRARIEKDRAGVNTARAGAEIRLGEGLLKRDQRGTDAKAPSWYFFVGADGEALVWNVADETSLDGLALRDQVTVGDVQAGVAMSRSGGQLSFGVVRRATKFEQMKRTDHFAAVSFTLKH